jgi:hypothetical protein
MVLFRSFVWHEGGSGSAEFYQDQIRVKSAISFFFVTLAQLIGSSSREWLRANAPEAVLLFLCIARLWLMAMPSSLWTDETATAFAARYPSDPSLAIASPYTQSVYYALPHAMDAWFGFSEIGYRIPSVIAMLLALWFLYRLTSRLIHPDAACFAVFACIAIREIDYFAIDAKPYALGMCVAMAALFYEVRWLDSARWRDGAAFLISGALLWRVHQVYWPFYAVLAVYAVARLWLRDTAVSIPRVAGVFAMLAIAVLPVALDSLRLLREAGSHSFVARPGWADLKHFLRPEWNYVAVAGGLAWLISRFIHGAIPARPRASSVILIVGCWILTPLAIFAFSFYSGTSLFVPRYLSLHLPGVALSATMAAALYLPREHWRPITLALAVGALLSLGNWKTVWPDHDPAKWRDAAEYVNFVSAGSDMPAFCISPFVEAAPPVWRPDYTLPGFLYAPLFAYPLRAKAYLLPYDPGGDFKPPGEADEYAESLADGELPWHEKFLIYGSIGAVSDWSAWFSSRLKTRNWRSEVHDFGDIRVSMFRRNGSQVEREPLDPKRPLLNTIGSDRPGTRSE